MQKILKLTSVSMLAIMATANANAAGYTCEELVDYTSCSPGYYMTEVDTRCPDGYYYETDICVYDEDGNAEYGYSEEECLDEEYMGGKAWYAQGCFSDDSWTYEPLADGGTVTSTCLECPAGSYCVGGDKDTAVKIACADGTYQPETGKALCETCPTPTLYPEYATVFSRQTVDFQAPNSEIRFTTPGTYCVAQYWNLPIANGEIDYVHCSNWGDTSKADYSMCNTDGYLISTDTYASARLSCDAGYYSDKHYVRAYYGNITEYHQKVGLSKDDFYECSVNGKVYKSCQNLDYFMNTMYKCQAVGKGYFSADDSTERSQCPVMTDASGNTYTSTTDIETAGSVTECVINVADSNTDDKGTFNRKLDCSYDDPKIYVPADGKCTKGYSQATSDIDGATVCYAVTTSECTERKTSTGDSSIYWNSKGWFCGCNSTSGYYDSWRYDGTSLYCPE